ncbi:MAG: hypothetical protein IT306_15625 [Chloroflexi bacterium]|nr:hypothetical protein [Chloroflexota bacterium]
MAEPTIIQQQREVVLAVKQLADQYTQEELDAENRLRLDREAADQAFAQSREAADTQLRRAYDILRTADLLVPQRGDASTMGEIVPAHPLTLFDTDLVIGLRITTAQMEARLLRIQSAMADGSSSNLITVGIIVGAVVAAGAILVMPFVAGSGNPGLSFGWFGAMVSPLVLALLVAGARATFLRPYTPDEDYGFIRQHMGYVLYMHQVLVEEARSTFDRRLNEWQERFDEGRSRIAQSFRQQLALLGPSIDKFNAAATAVGPEWSAPAWNTWMPSTRMPRAICVGELLAGIRDDRITLPALVPFPHDKPLIIKTDTHARERAIEAVQSILLRLVATVPPGDLKFTLIDPLGQGRNVAPFLAFADAGLGIGEGRSWSEPMQIEQRLSDLANLVEGAAEATAFASMLPRLDPNRANGVAEPCRVLVMLDFPTNVSGPVSRLLTPILQKGPRYGVHPILLVDTDQSMPYGFNLHEMEQIATTLAWDGRRFVWHDPDFKNCWVELDKPPRGGLAKKIIHGVQPQVLRTA